MIDNPTNTTPILVTPYTPTDYPGLKHLYQQSDLYGGQFDPDRDSEERLRRRIEADPDAILIAKIKGKVVGTVSLIEDARVAWLFRFAVERSEHEAAITEQLCSYALNILRQRGHSQVLVYTPTDNQHLHERYEQLGFQRGNDYTCYWREF